MTTEEIFAEISAHQIKGVMLHVQMSECFGFLNLCGWKKLHKHRMHEELKDYCQIRAFYICEYGVLLQDKKAEDPEEVKTAEKMLLELEDVDYDMCTIYRMQGAAMEK